MPKIVGDTETRSAEFDVDSSKQVWTIEEGGAVIIDNGAGVFESSRFHDNIINVNGLVSANQPGGAGIFSAGLKTTVRLGTNAEVTGFTAVDMRGDKAQLVSHGRISAPNIAVLMTGDNATVKNFSDISTSNGIALDLRGGQNDHVENSGVIGGLVGIAASGAISLLNHTGATVSGIKQAIVLTTAAGDLSTIENSGVITTIGTSIAGGSGDEHVINHGIIRGAVTLGAGNDVFDNINGIFDSTVSGGKGDDTYIVDNAIHIAEKAGEGHDTVKSSRSFTLSGSLEDLVLTGKANLSATGNGAANHLSGNGADNVIDGQFGDDILTGGKGHDTFVFRTFPDKDSNIDHVTDFNSADDQFQLDNVLIPKLPEGALAKSALFIGIAAHDSNDRIIYDQKHGSLFFDRDGSGELFDKQLIAEIDNHAGMNEHDFQII